MQSKILAMDKKLKNRILKAIADEYSRAILSYAIDKPKSVLDISKECNIPLSTAYRRVHELEMDGLLTITGSIINNGKRYYLYQSKIKSVRILFGIGSTEIEVIQNDNMGRSAYW